MCRRDDRPAVRRERSVGQPARAHAARGDAEHAGAPSRRGRYYRTLLGEIASAARLSLELADNPHRWEGMADVAVVGDQVVLTHAVPGHYDRETTPKSSRSSRAGAEFAATFTGVPRRRGSYAELVYPHFHGDTLPSTSVRDRRLAPRPRPLRRRPVRRRLRQITAALGADRIVPIGRDDAVEQYAATRGRSRRVLVPDGVSDAYVAELTRLGW